METTRRKLLALSAAGAAIAASGFKPAPLAASVPVAAAPDDIVWIKANGPMGHISTLRSTIGLSRQLDTFGWISSAADLQRQVFHGNTWIHQHEFMGLSARYSVRDTTQAQSAANVIDGRGTGYRLASAWLIGWGEHSVCVATPDGSPVVDEGDAALVVRDWRYIARVANIDRRVATDELTGLLSIAALHLPFIPPKATLYLPPELYGHIGPVFRKRIAVRGVAQLSFNEARIV
jgi:hypothetical protein